LVERWLTLPDSGCRVHYWDGGQGRALLLLHGLGGSALDWCAAAPLLAQGQRVIVPDLPGFGESDPWPRLHLESGEEFVEAFCQVLRMEGCVLVGNSMGGAVALQAGLYLGERLAGLVLADSAGLGRELAWSYRLLGLPGIGRWARPPSARGVRAHWRRLVYDLSSLPPGFLEAKAEAAQARGPRLHLFRVGRLGISLRGQRLDLRRAAGQLSCPVLVLWGVHDRIIPVRHGLALAAGLPQARVQVFARCGHCPQLEVPAAFAGQVRDFVAALGPCPVPPGIAAG
jgi:pimeloyl-ACP methyl ester carboxylesterase